MADGRLLAGVEPAADERPAGGGQRPALAPPLAGEGDQPPLGGHHVRRRGDGPAGVFPADQRPGGQLPAGLLHRHGTEAPLEGFRQQGPLGHHRLAGEAVPHGVIDRQSLAAGRPRMRHGPGTHPGHGVPLGRREPGRPRLPQPVPGDGVALPLPRLGPELGLAVGVGDALLGGECLDLRGPPGEPRQDGGRHAGQLEVVPLADHPVPQVLQPVGQPHPEGRLVVRGIPLEVAELPRLPLAFGGVEGGVGDEAVGVELGVGHPADGPGGGVDELGPEQVAGGPVLVPAALADPAGHLRLDLPHGVFDGPAEGGQQVGVVVDGEGQGHRLGHREGEVVPGGAVGPGAGGERVAGLRVQVVAQPVELVPADRARQAEPFGRPAAPAADQLLPLAVVVGGGVVPLGGGRRLVLGNPEHGPSYRRPHRRKPTRARPRPPRVSGGS